MKWLEIGYIKAHSRIDFDCEDAELELLGTSAEEAVLNLCNRSFEDLKKEYCGKVPENIIHASLMLTEHFYQNRGIVTPGNMSVVPYAFDLLIKPYMKL